MNSGRPQEAAQHLRAKAWTVKTRLPPKPELLPDSAASEGWRPIQRKTGR